MQAIFLGLAWIYLAEFASWSPRRSFRPGSGVGGRDQAWAPPDRETPLQPLDLIRGNAHSEAQPAVFVTAVHDLGMFVEPMQPLPVAGVERQFEFRPAARQAILDRRQKMSNPLPGHRGNGKRRGLPCFLLLSERGARVRVKQIHLVPGLNDAIGKIGDADFP